MSSSWLRSRCSILKRLKWCVFLWEFWILRCLSFGFWLLYIPNASSFLACLSVRSAVDWWIVGWVFCLPVWLTDWRWSINIFLAGGCLPSLLTNFLFWKSVWLTSIWSVWLVGYLSDSLFSAHAQECVVRSVFICSKTFAILAW